MLYLKPHKGGYLYATGNEGPIIEFEVEYRLGGQTWGEIRPRGIYVTVSPVTIEKRDGGYITRCISLFGNEKVSGGWIFVEQLPRKSPKKLDRAAEFFDEIAPTVADLWPKDISAAKKLLFERLEEFQKSYPAAKAA